MSDASAAGRSPRRCFLALLPDAEGRAALVQSRSIPAGTLPPSASGVRWVAPESLHLTLRFLGNSDPAQMRELQNALPALARHVPPLTARRYGIWPNRSRPRMLVLELQIDPALAQLAAECEVRARAIGFPPERRPFRAHATLARLRPGCAFGSLPPPAGISVTFDRIALVESTLGKPAAVYTTLASTALPARA